METTFSNIQRLTVFHRVTTMLKKDSLNDVALESLGRKMPFLLVERRDLSCKFVSKNILIVLRRIHVYILKSKSDLYNLFENSGGRLSIFHTILNKETGL